MDQTEKDWLQKILTPTQRIKAFGKSVLADLGDKKNSLTAEINDITERIEIKEFILQTSGILSLVDSKNQDTNESQSLIRLKPDGKWFGQVIIDDFFRSDLKPLEKERKNILRAINIITGREEKIRKSGKINTAMVETAREFPLITLASAYVENFRKSGSKTYKGNCPFHDDRTPSFVAYTDSNRFICFGCETKGDVISFLMEIKSINFKTAVRALVALSGK
ncbi:MAG: CHC2 zinc finger domain-containing protein [Candidatus Taylorbacteria bacterium]|nr:CHC2 zinc finger domain-containing protein [Candidatus Taylorbacteria bacterium]